ncbi:MAG: SPOR domain-containing protein, partial [Chitinophagales bacterium]
YQTVDSEEDYASIAPATPVRTSERTTTELKNTYSSDEITFRIQIGAFRKKLSPNASIFQQIYTDVMTEEIDQITRYLTGRFSDYKEAEQYCQQLQREGIPDAFVAAYLNGYRLEMRMEEVLAQYGGK